jgi:hypothetical protein
MGLLPSQRAAFLRERCGGDEDRIGAIRALIRAREQEDSPEAQTVDSVAKDEALSSLLSGRTATIEATEGSKLVPGPGSSTSPTSRSIDHDLPIAGRYRLREKIGEGEWARSGSRSNPNRSAVALRSS